MRNPSPLTTEMPSPLAAVWRRFRSNGARSAAIAVLLLCALGFFGYELNRVYPISNWLFLTYIKVWLKLALFAVSAFAIGLAAFDRLIDSHPRLLERATLAFSLGVLIVYLSLYGLGIVGLLSPALFYCLPAALLGIGGPHLLSVLRRSKRRFRNFSGQLIAPRSSVEWAALAFLIVCCALVYVPLLVPNNVTYDAQWYHMTIGEDYAATGRIHPFPEGWFVGTYPQLASILYAWAFLGGGLLHERVLLCVHLEFLLLLGTLLSVSALASKIARKRIPLAAAGFFLFPGIFVYDACLGGGADHILAFFTPVVALTLLRLGKVTTPREAILSGAMLSAAVCTKYQACYLVAPSVIAILFLGIRYRKFCVVVIWGAVVGSISSTHWLKNLLYYGDPFYPLSHALLPSRPFHSDAAEWLRIHYWPAYAEPVGVGWGKVKNAILATLNFSFAPNGSFTWKSQDLPLFGSLYTLLIPVALFTKRPRRLLSQILAIQLCVAVWYLTSRQERFLQVLTPWIAATTVAILVRVSDQGRLARFCVLPLVLLQLIWGADLWTLPRHAMNGRAPLQAAIEHFAAGYDVRKTTRFKFVQILEDLRPRLQAGAVPLLHLERRKLGLGVHAISDEIGWQGGINYLEHRSPKVTLEQWSRFGVTHVLWQRRRGYDSPEDVARELVFLRAVALATHLESSNGDWNLATFSRAAAGSALAAEETRIVWLACNSAREPGVYTPRGLERAQAEQYFETARPDALTPSTFNGANAVVIGSHCFPGTPIESLMGGAFSHFGDLSHLGLWVRTSETQGQPQPKPHPRSP